jgi:ABC-type lipoprotein release transport system permease subunit
LVQKHLPIRRLITIIFSGKASLRLMVATLLSFAFSIAVILSTVGLMSGFEHALKYGVRSSTGDLTITSRTGFFELTPAVEQELKKSFEFSKVIQSEGFVIGLEHSYGVLVRGIAPEEFKNITDLNLSLLPDEIVIGQELAKSMSLKAGDSLTLTMASSKQSQLGLPSLYSYKIRSIIEHGIYEKDLRFVYLHRETLSQIIGSGTRANMLVLKRLNEHDSIEELQRKLSASLDYTYIVRPYWYEFSGLLRAVEVEKFSITLMLQLIVVIAVFNISAFIIYVNEKKAQDYFLLRVLGLESKRLTLFWYFIMLLIWGLACSLSLGFLQIFDWALANLSIFNIPGKIYVLSHLELILAFSDYLIIFSLALLWMLLITFILVRRWNNKTILSGLRREFQ